MNPSSSSSLSCCCASNSVDLSEILRRITPIDYFPGFINDENPCPFYKGTLLVDSNQYIYGTLAFPICGSDPTQFGTVIDETGISTRNVYVANSIYVGQTQITSSGSILELPCGTTVCGVPIGSASIQFFMLQVSPTSGQQSNLPITSAGDYIVGGFFQNGYLSFVQYVYYWPCLFSTAAKVNSISIYWNVATGAAGLPITANNIVAELRIRKQDGTIINTGQTVTYAPAVANNTSYFISVEGLSYDVAAGDRAGMYISWDGQLASNDNYHYSWITYNIGYTPSI